MSACELVFRILLAMILPPLGVIGLPGVGCGTLILLAILTLLFWIPGEIVAIILIAQEYSKKAS